MKIISKKSNYLHGKINPPPDKSISHRAIIISALSKGVSYIENLLSSEDIKVTLSWAKKLGVDFIAYGNKLKVCSGIDLANKITFTDSFKFYLGNSGTSARLLMGVMAGLGNKCLFYGDDSLQKRPMLRVITPLSLMGAKIFAKNNLSISDSNHKAISIDLIDSASNNDLHLENLTLINNSNTKAYLPVILQGGSLKGINYQLPVASAQIKSAILLAGLFTKDEVAVTELAATRDHTENMLLAANIELKIETNSNKAKVITLPKGNKVLKPCSWQVPGDFSSSAFIIAAALLVPNSKVLIKGVNLNPLRTGFLQVLQQMKANLKIHYKNKVCGELFGDIEISYTKDLHPIVVNKELVPLMIDEFPILACLVSLIKGESKFLGVNELRYKESDRILAIEDNLNKLGIVTTSTKDSLTIQGNPNIINKPLITVNPNLDHRIAMAFLVLGLIMNNGIIVKDTDTISTSFPNFVSLMQQLGANINIVN